MFPGRDVNPIAAEMSSTVNTLKESSEFLNLLLDHIDAAVLIADETLQIHQFNKSFLDLFDTASTAGIGQSFGMASGCVNAVLENRSCGETTHCHSCLLRRSLIAMLTEKATADRKRLERVFYINGEPHLKYLEFSARPIQFQGRRMILVIIYDMTDIETQKRTIEDKQKQIESDLKAAAAIQQSLLPHGPPDLSWIRSAWRSAPCQQVGGDIFQIQIDTPEAVSVYIIDVCGHGVSAALVSVAVSQFLSSLHNRARLTRKTFSPEAVLNRLDDAFPIDRFDCHFTIVYGSMNRSDGRFVYSNAGHVPPLRLRAGGGVDVLSHHGTVIGTGMGFPFTQDTVQLKRGDTVVLYTDGLIDNFGPEADRDKKSHFMQFMERVAGEPAGRLVTRVMEEAKIRRGAENPEDDMSLIAIDWVPD